MPNRYPRVQLYGAIPLLLIGLASCGSGTPTVVHNPTEAPPAIGVSTDTSSTTATVNTSPTEPSMAGRPSFTVSVAEPDGDKVSLEGRFGPVVPASQSTVSQTALSECPQPASDGRAMVTQLDLATTVKSSLAAEVQLGTSYLIDVARNIPLVNFVMGYREGPECDNGQPGSATINLGKLQPHQTDHFTMWVVLPDAITPNRPHPTERQLGRELWLMALPVPVVQGGSTSSTIGERPVVHTSGSRIVSCEHANFGGEEHFEYLAVSGDTATTLRNEEACPTES